MATITGYTAARMLAIENETIVDGDVIGDNLILYRRDGTQIDAGVVVGAAGPPGPGTDPLVFDIDEAGKLSWGSGSALDTYLYRQGAGIIKTDGKLNAVGGLQINGVDVGAGATINAKTASYTLVLGDAGDIIEISNAGAVTLTVPANASVAFPIGTMITVIQTGAGQITVTPAATVTINGNPGLKTNGQWAAATLIKRATNTWVLIGNITV